MAKTKIATVPTMKALLQGANDLLDAIELPGSEKKPSRKRRRGTQDTSPPPRHGSSASSEERDERSAVKKKKVKKKKKKDAEVPSSQEVEGGFRRKGGARPRIVLTSTWDALEKSDGNGLKWTEDGTAFFIATKHMNDFLKQNTHCSSADSFVRNLNMYGFKTSRSPDGITFRHPQFTKKDRGAISKIQRQEKRSTLTAKQGTGRQRVLANLRKLQGHLEREDVRSNTEKLAEVMHAFVGTQRAAFQIMGWVDKSGE